MSNPETIKAQFEQADQDRASMLCRAREAARLSQPSLLPQQNLQKDSEIEKSFQSTGGVGLVTLTSKLLLATFPPGSPWFRFALNARVLRQPWASRDVLDAIITGLYAREIAIQARLDATNHRTAMRSAIEQILGVGNALIRSVTMENGDYRFRNYRLDTYVQKRDGNGEILWLITKEIVEPEQLSPEDLAVLKASTSELKSKNSTNPLILYTRATRQKDTSWVVEQAIEEAELPHRRSEEPVNPFIVAGYVEIPGEDYSRGFVEERIADLRTLDALSLGMIDYAAAASKLTPVVDRAESGGLTPDDLMLPNGVAIAGRVLDGEVKGVAYMQVKKGGDMAAPAQLLADTKRDVNQQFLSEAGAQRNKDRVTATEAQSVISQFRQAHGGALAQFHEDLQVGSLRRTTYQMDRDNLLPPVANELKGDVDFEVLTGLQALSRQMELDKAMQVLPIIAQSPELAAWMSPERVINVLMRGVNLPDGTLVKTKEEMRAELETEMRKELRAAAGQQAIATAGKVVETAAQGEAAQTPTQ